MTVMGLLVTERMFSIFGGIGCIYLDNIVTSLTSKIKLLDGGLPLISNIF